MNLGKYLVAFCAPALFGFGAGVSMLGRTDSAAVGMIAFSGLLVFIGAVFEASNSS